MNYNNLSKKELIYMLRSVKNESVRESTDVYRYLMGIKLNYKQENFIILALNGINVPIDHRILSIGGVNQTIVDLKLLFNWLLTLDNVPTSFIIAHNHPSGNLKPSEEDKSITKRIIDAAKIFGMSMLDHIIFNRDNFSSMAEDGFIN